jgi:hypothetical protein
MAAYDPTTPPERQVQSWACSIRATTWILRSLGIDITAAQLQGEMVPAYVTPELGLLDGRGIGLAEVLRRHLSPETPVEVLWAPTWDDVIARAGRGPIGVGSGSLYHWLNIARVLSPGVLDAPNPAPNYPPGAPLHDNLTRAEFDKYAPWALVFVQVTPAVDPAPPVVVKPPAPAPEPRGYVVGSGLLNAMTKVGEHPASDEVHHGESGRGYAEAFSDLGRRWTWVDSLGIVVVYEGWRGT